VTETLRVDSAQLSRGVIGRAAAAIRAGAVVAIPTDTIYGLAGNPFNAGAVQQIVRLKGRPESKPILLLVDSVRQVETLAVEIPAAFERLAARFWPGPLTIILRAAPAVPRWITAGTGTVAVRLPGSLLAREIARAAHVPLTGTSANRSGAAAALRAGQVGEQFPRGLALIVDGGPARTSAPSTLLDLTGEPRVLREGPVPAADVLSLSGT
jgi:L-threonylcarbamoyladenylate synthase